MSNTSLAVRMLEGIFVTVVTLNWLYILLVQYQPFLIMNSWFVISPFILLFYFISSVAALYGIYKRENWGFSLAYVAILFGAFSATLSYGIIGGYPFLEKLYIAILLANLFVLVCLMFYTFSQTDEE